MKKTSFLVATIFIMLLNCVATASSNVDNTIKYATGRDIDYLLYHFMGYEQGGTPCGVEALYIGLSYLGIPINWSTVIEQMKTQPQNSLANLAGIRNFAATYVPCALSVHFPQNTPDVFLSKMTPFIAHVKKNHFVAVLSWSNGVVVYGDMLNTDIKASSVKDFFDKEHFTGNSLLLNQRSIDILQNSIHKKSVKIWFFISAGCLLSLILSILIIWCKFKDNVALVTILCFLLAITSCSKDKNHQQGTAKLISTGYDWGYKSNDTAIKGEIKIFNDGNGNLKVKSIKPSCSCIKIGKGNFIISPQKNESIDYIIDIHDKWGELYFNILIETDDPENKYLTYTTRGIAGGDKVVFAPDSLTLGAIDFPKVVNKNVRMFFPIGNNTVRLKDVNSTSSAINAQIFSAGAADDGVKYQTISIDIDLHKFTPGVVKEDLIVEYEESKQIKKHSIPITGLIKNEYNIFPGSPHFDKVKMGDTKSLYVRISRKDGKEFSITQIKGQTPDTIRMNIPFNVAKKQHEIEIQFVANTIGLYSQKIILKCEQGNLCSFTISALVVP